MYPKFAPAYGASSAVNNATSATAAIKLPYSSDGLYLANTSATAVSYVRVTYFETAAVGTGDAPAATTDIPILPANPVFIACPPGHKVIRTIASAADGKIQITPGNFL